MISDTISRIILWFGNLGYTGVFVSSIGVLPAEIIIAMTSASMPGHMLEISLATALGEVVGAIPTFLIGYFFSKKTVLDFLNNKVKFITISEEEYTDAHGLIKKYGPLYVIISRLIPGLRMISSLVAGFTKQNFLIFIISVFTGSFIFGYIFAYLGSELGLTAEQIQNILNTSKGIAVLVVAVLIYIYTKWKKKFKNKE